MTTEDTRTLALRVIAESRHDSYDFIANKLNQMRVPTLSGRGRWNRGTVCKVATEAGMPCRYVPMQSRVA